MPKGKTILTRIVFGAVLIAVVGGLLAADHLALVAPSVPGLLLACLIVVLSVPGYREMSRLAAAAGPGALAWSGHIGAAALGTMPVWLQVYPFRWTGDFVWVVLGAIVIAVFLEQMIRRRVDGAVGRVAATLLGVLYLGVGAAAMLTIRLDWGVGALVLLLAAVKFTDIGAYFTGTAIGRHKLIAWLSPGKSWEGLIGGLLAAGAVSVLTVWALRYSDSLRVDMRLATAAGFGVVVGLVGQFGDLCESLLKRSAAVKDSGSLVPEFGGVLDILDSPLLAAPVAYLILTIIA